MKRARILLADDHSLVVEAIKRLLEVEYNVVGCVADGRELLEKAPALRPDVVILDIHMPNMNGIEAARALKKLLPSARIVFLTSSRDAALASAALAAGASGFLLKSSAGTELEQAIEAAMRGETYVTPSMAGAIFESARRGEEDPVTPRQREVLQLLVEGHTMRAIAKKLGVSASTVAHHKYTMMESLGIVSSAELILYAAKKGYSTS